MTDSGRNHLVFIVEIIKLYAVLSLTLREERRPRVSENRVLRRIFGPKRDKLTEKWRKLHNEELDDLHSSRKYFRVIE
jgi:hypothetical protein